MCTWKIYIIFFGTPGTVSVSSLQSELLLDYVCYDMVEDMVRTLSSYTKYKKMLGLKMNVQYAPLL